MVDTLCVLRGPFLFNNITKHLLPILPACPLKSFGFNCEPRVLLFPSAPTEPTYAAIEPDTKPTEPTTAAAPPATAAGPAAAAAADDTHDEDAESGQGRQAEGPHDGVRVLCTNVPGGAQEEAPGGECDLCRVLEKVRRAVEGQYQNQPT